MENSVHTENSDDHRRMDEEEERGREEREKNEFCRLELKNEEKKFKKCL